VAHEVAVLHVVVDEGKGGRRLPECEAGQPSASSQPR
jgi:hypothetical protein